MRVLVYVEGGYQASTKSACRQAFRLFFEKVIPQGSFRVIACGDRASAFQDFRAALSRHRDDYVVLLVDSEAPVTTNSWEHLRTRVGDGWQRPPAATEDQAHLMVQIMEAWFLADRPTLIEYYGQGFLANSLPGQPNVELVAKQSVFESLKRASRPTQKGEYHKTRHAFDLLERIDPRRVRAASSHANRLLTALERVVEAGKL